MSELGELALEVKSAGNDVELAKLKLKELLNVKCIPQRTCLLPLDTSVKVKSVGLNGCTVFNSATRPLRLPIVSEDGREYKIIFKQGDDLRQDQFVLQMIRIMDHLLKSEGMDLMLTPYNVLPIKHYEEDPKKDYGMLECVLKSKTIQEIKDNGFSLKQYLLGERDEQKFPTAESWFQFVQQNFIKSCGEHTFIFFFKQDSLISEKWIFLHFPKTSKSRKF